MAEEQTPPPADSAPPEVQDVGTPPTPVDPPEDTTTATPDGSAALDILALTRAINPDFPPPNLPTPQIQPPATPTMPLGSAGGLGFKQQYNMKRIPATFMAKVYAGSSGATYACKEQAGSGGLTDYVGGRDVQATEVNGNLGVPVDGSVIVLVWSAWGYNGWEYYFQYLGGEGSFSLTVGYWDPDAAAFVTHLPTTRILFGEDVTSTNIVGAVYPGESHYDAGTSTWFIDQFVWTLNVSYESYDGGIPATSTDQVTQLLFKDSSNNATDKVGIKWTIIIGDDNNEDTPDFAHKKQIRIEGELSEKVLKDVEAESNSDAARVDLRRTYSNSSTPSDFPFKGPWLFPVKLTMTGGSGTSAAPFQYTVKTITGTTIGTAMTPNCAPPGGIQMIQATWGEGYYDNNGDAVLHRAHELFDSAPCVGGG